MTTSFEKGGSQKTWLILAALVLVIILLAVIAYSTYTKSFSKKTSLSSQPPSSTTNNLGVFTGTVKSGSQTKGKEYCPEGMYLVSDPGKYLVGQTTMLLLKEPGAQNPEIVSDQTILNKKVKVKGIYPAQDFFCEALICECEDYILVNEITLIQ